MKAKISKKTTTMPKLIEEVATRTSLEVTDVDKTLRAAFEVIMETLQRGEGVHLANFGRFEARPYIMTPRLKPAAKLKPDATLACAISFRAFRQLKDRVRSGLAQKTWAAYEQQQAESTE